ncbi:uncharacterized protein M437DRAFT_42021 [Aureobasidium melanogenum CBS 110374]|uniref:Uncharacterized protein n=1 Tax=Aureobasidium melanogenum (strain CBS 110374) TaxID=1043003 RepID=A0A074WRH2_AURM1|nr:uncharacterized protein M437DRAFT_42021 [Aureobasidium melanogenum CBS 110374]KEQ65031.1 hypothetical protein M437DRAFT_42021 [Aureobasidium melanogenum CBS 110374]
MKLIPNFFLRSATRLLLFQAVFAWLFMRIRSTHLPSALRMPLMGATGLVIGNTQSYLDLYAGFDLPWEATFFLPILFNEYIKSTMPELAILLGITPCFHDVVYKDGGRHCRQDLAYDCFTHALLEDGKQSLKVMEDCYEDFGYTATEALQHHNQCHASDDLEFTGAAACVRAGAHLVKKQKISLRIFPALRCNIMYAGWDIITPMLNEIGAQVDTRGSSEFCWKNIDLANWTVSRTRTGRMQSIIRNGR